MKDEARGSFGLPGNPQDKPQSTGSMYRKAEEQDSVCDDVEAEEEVSDKPSSSAQVLKKHFEEDDLDDGVYDFRH